ncbi:MAG: PrsW family intramembrane metalloprotease [Microbacterium sp.]|uniref:PrsW family intramembrane metalloprotease n=1 Tax=Microbacterium sp. TaxID=51671 RepID=UPI003A87DF6C
MSFPSPLSQPQPGAPALVPPAPPAGPTPLPVAPRRAGSAAIWIIGVLAVVLVGVVGYFLTFLGAGASLIGMVLALIPLVVVLAVVRVIDRWEPEPLRLLVLAFVWGAVAAVALTLLVDTGLRVVLDPQPSGAQDVLSGIVQAPIVEELAKGLGLLIILATGRRAFDGPVDGVVYGAMIGAGFAFTENIQYFAIAFIEGGLAQTSTTFFMRGILSPFAHVMFTAVTGFALGLAARRGARGAAALRPWLAGLAGAIMLHALWNGSALLGDFFALYLTLQVPLFLGFIVGIIALRREEARLTRARLSDYAAAGWFTPQEVEMLATPVGRRTALAWAKTLRGDRTDIMRAFVRDATALAATRQRALTGRDPRAVQDEHAYLERAAAARAALLAP